MHPKEAVNEYIEQKKYGSASSTITNYRYRLKRFLEYCAEASITKISDVTPRVCEQYKQSRLKNPEVNAVTLEQQMRTFRQFIEWCESNEFVKDGTTDKILIPQIEDRDQEVRHEALDADRADQIIEWLMKHRYATRQHIAFHTLWHTSVRLGSLRALDLQDFTRVADGGAVLEFRHRPETETPLKLKSGGERDITITDDRLSEAIEDYIQYERPPVEDSHGREPLIATTQGRPALGTLRSDVYTVVQPCRYTGECPHGEEIGGCEMRTYGKRASCPSSVYPHALRSGSVTDHLNRDVPKEIVSERANMSEATLDQHYDERTKDEKRRRREKYL
jgi:site-specific recombinase XerD